MRPIPDLLALNEPEQKTGKEPAPVQAATAQHSSDRTLAEVDVNPNQPVLNPAVIGAITLLPVLVVAIALSHRKQQRNLHRQQIHRLEKLWQLSPQNNLDR